MKDFLITVIETQRRIYRVPAIDEAEARNKIENIDQTYQLISDEYNDLESIGSIEEDV